MALIYDERTGEFINAPDNRHRPTTTNNGRTGRTGRTGNTGGSGRSDRSGCMASIFESITDGCLGCLEEIFYGIIGLIIYFGVPLIGILLLFRMCS